MQGFFPTHGLTHKKALHGGYRFSLERIIGHQPAITLLVCGI